MKLYQPLFKHHQGHWVTIKLEEWVDVDLLEEDDNIFYHGSDSKFDIFNKRSIKRGSAFFLTKDSDDAKSYGKYVYKIKVKKVNLFDYRNNIHLQNLEKGIDEVLQKESKKPYRQGLTFYPFTKSKVLDGIKKGQWHYIEQPIIIKALTLLKYNGFIEIEGQNINYGFFNPNDLQIIDKLEEELRLSDFQKSAGLSAFTKKFANERKKLVGGENKNSKLVKLVVNTKKDYVTFIFMTPATHGAKVSVVNPKRDFVFTGKDYTDYTFMIRILDFFKWARTTPGYKSAKLLSTKDLKEILQASSIQVFCNCGSYTWQGAGSILTQFDASIFPNHIMPTYWNKFHNDDNFLCKHLSNFFLSIGIQLSKMSSSLNKYLKAKM